MSKHNNYPCYKDNIHVKSNFYPCLGINQAVANNAPYYSVEQLANFKYNGPASCFNEPELYELFWPGNKFIYPKQQQEQFTNAYNKLFTFNKTPTTKPAPVESTESD